MNYLTHLSEQQRVTLFKEMYYLNMAELRELCTTFRLPKKGKKAHLIDVIKTYLLTGEILKETPIPEVSCGKGPAVLQADELVLFGSYKNDLRTRIFLKTLVGNHFHYTAWGLDWLRSRWEEGNPPTYQEFADAWQGNYVATQVQKHPPKQEWALIRFCLAYAEKHPEASRAEVIQAWKEVRAEIAQRVKDSLYGLVR